LLGEIETWEYPERARPHLQESELLLREIGDFGRLAWNLGKSGTLAMQEGEFETAQAMFEESLALQEMLDLRESGFTLVYLGNLHTKLGNYPLAEAYYERILSNYGQTEYHGAERYASVELGNVYLHQGKLDQAEQLFIKSQSYFKGLEDLQGVAYSLERLASVAVRRHKLEKAVHLYAWADTMRQGKRPLTEQEDVDRDITAVRELLDEETFDAAHAAGQAMTVEEAIALALQGNVDKAQM
jgi:tetratricopeptide (TPR) repeat protein